MVLQSGGSEPQARIARVLRQRGTLSQAEIARLTGLAKSTVSEAVAELRALGVVVDAGTTREPAGAGQGRRGVGVMLSPRAGTCIGIDFGFRAIRAIAADVSHAVIARREVRLEQDYPLATGIATAKRLVRELSDVAGVEASRLLGIGAAVPGPVDPATGAVQMSSMIPTWTGVRVAAELEEHLGHRVLADNESNCAALAEYMWASGQGTSSMAYFKLHSGIGGALIVDGRLVRGIAGGAGEFGHITLDPNGPLCRCGKRGCLETYAGIPALLAQLQPRYGADFTIGGFLGQIEAGDPGCHTILSDAADAVSRAIAAVCNAVNPERVVIGGALAEAGDRLLDSIRERFSHYTLINEPLEGQPSTELTLGALGRDASALGAVGLVLTELTADPIGGRGIERTA